MTLRVVGLRAFSRDGEIDAFDFSGSGTLLIGPRNSSKSTTLRMIDYCLGDSDSPREALGPDVQEAYLGLELDLVLSGAPHQLRRSFDRSFGPIGKVRADGLELTTSELGAWLMAQLGWPQLEIPLGRVARSATELVPLTFRTLLRHIYRKEGSWLTFASEEQEFHRRAVLAFFLGLAETRYSNEEFRLGETERKITALKAELQGLDELTDQTVRRVTEELGLPQTSARGLRDREAELATEAEVAEQRRQTVIDQMQATGGFVSELSEAYESASSQLADLTERQRNLAAALRGLMAARETNHAQGARLERAESAIELFSALPVTMCPVCGQPPPGRPTEAAEHGRCYLCSQGVAADARQRRVALERQILQREAVELEEAIGRTEDDLGRVDAIAHRLTREHEELARRLDAERRDLVAPFVSELEGLSRDLGGIEQKRAALQGLAVLTERRGDLERAIERANAEADIAADAARRVGLQRLETHRRCARFSGRMQEFLDLLTVEPWRFGRVAMAEEELAFFIGDDPWDVTLGGESKVVFLLAYHYALLNLPSDLPGVSHPPGVAILDNPLQQGVPNETIGECLDLILTAAEANAAQALITLAHGVPTSRPVDVRRLRKQYGEPSG